jgi:hypothetical protein
MEKILNTKKKLLLFASKDLKIVFKEDMSHNEYKKYLKIIINKTNFFPANYTENTINYYKEYFLPENFFDLTCIFFSQNNPVAIWPLFYSRKFGLGYFDRPVYQPIFVDSFSKKNKKKIQNQLILFLKDLNKETELKISEIFDGLQGVSNWIFLLKNNFKLIKLNQYYYLHILNSLDEIKKNFSQNTRNLVNKNNNFSIFLFEKNICPDIWSDFMKLHKIVSNKSTRSEQSWKLQLKSLLNEDSFFICAYHGKKIISGAFYLKGKNQAIYGVSATLEKYKKSNIFYHIKKKSIEYLITQKIKWLFLGKCYDDFDNVSDRQKTISSFKEKFSSNLIFEYIFSNS